MSYYMVQTGIIAVEIKTHFSIESVIFYLPKVLKDLLLDSANFVKLIPLCFSSYVCANALPTVHPLILLILIFPLILTFSKGCIGSYSYYEQHSGQC